LGGISGGLLTRVKKIHPVHAAVDAQRLLEMFLVRKIRKPFDFLARILQQFGS
jgi:hypothetical protein